MSYNSTQFWHYLEIQSDPQVKGSVLQDWSNLTHTDTHTHTHTHTHIYKIAPSSVNFRSQSQVQSFTGDSDQPALYQNFPQTTPRVWLISWSSSQNSRENFYLLDHWRITKDTTLEQTPGRGTQGRVWEDRTLCRLPLSPIVHMVTYPEMHPSPDFFVFFFFFPGGSIM